MLLAAELHEVAAVVGGLWVDKYILLHKLTYVLFKECLHTALACIFKRICMHTEGWVEA